MEWEGTAVFGEQLVFAQRLASWNGRRVQYFLIKAQHYPRILSRGKQDSWLTPGFLHLLLRVSERHEHTMFQRHYFTALFSAGLSLHPKSPQLHFSGSPPNNVKPVCLGVCVCVCYISAEFNKIPS